MFPASAGMNRDQKGRCPTHGSVPRICGDEPTPPGDWNTTAPQTGAPPGIDPGWDYVPGASVADEVGRLAGKTLQWDYSLAKAYMQEVPDRDLFAWAYRALPLIADDVRHYAQAVQAGRPVQPYRTLGLLTEADAARVRELSGLEVGGYDYALDASAVGHIRKKHGSAAGEASRGQRAMTAEDYAGLPGMLNDLDRVEDGGRSDTGQPVVRYVKEIGGEIHTAAFEARKGQRMLALISVWIRKTP